MTLKVSYLRPQQLFLFVLLILLSACQAVPRGAGTSTGAVPGPTATLPPTAAQVVPSLTPAASLTPTPSAPAVWLPPYLPDALIQSLHLPEGLALSKNESDAALRLDVTKKLEKSAKDRTTAWVYALVAPFPTVADEVNLLDLRMLWEGSPPKGFPLQSLLIDPSTWGVFEKLWGPPGERVKLSAAGQLLDTAWKTPGAGSILPFERLEPRWKVLAVDGQSPVQKSFNPAKFGLTAYFSLQGAPDALASANLTMPLAKGNRQDDRLTTVVVTGVTALVRGTGAFMERYGNTYPAREIGPWLREADILHISNEVPFARTCPEPYNWEGLVFCSRTKYIELLEDVGTDVVELSGDHFQDWGKEAMLYTLDLYKERGWKYYGGGKNIEEARQAVRFEHNGNRIAFIGCNAKPPGYAGASPTNPGAIHCNFDQMTADVEKLREEGYLPIVTFQHLEYYSYDAHPILQQDFAKMAAAGAVIVSGSQAHQPHAMTFTAGSFLHYGLGNLFFDQTNQGDAPRTAFIDRHIFYNGKHISTELLTIYLVDYARSRPMTPDERKALLETIFIASGWEVNKP